LAPTLRLLVAAVVADQGAVFARIAGRSIAAQP
jgi:hypothetical protein